MCSNVWGVFSVKIRNLTLVGTLVAGYILLEIGYTLREREYTYFVIGSMYIYTLYLGVYLIVVYFVIGSMILIGVTLCNSH